MAIAGDELQVVHLRNDFYRDGFYKILLALGTMAAAIALLIALSLYLYLAKPPPIHFIVDNEWRVVPEVPLDKPYLPDADLVQWVTTTIPAVFTYDFVHYSDQLKNAEQYFTSNGWQKFSDLVNQFANSNEVQKSKFFINTYPSGAPIILNQGLLNGRYAWWVQIPLNINYAGNDKTYSQTIMLQVLVVRISTLNDLLGVAIDNLVLVTKGGGSQTGTNAQ